MTYELKELLRPQHSPHSGGRNRRLLVRATIIFTQSRGYSIEVGFSLHSNEGNWKNEETILVPSGTVTSQFNSDSQSAQLLQWVLYFFLSL